MANSEALKINLAALKKVDSSISSIVDSENQVALYKYLSEAGKWVRYTFIFISYMILNSV